MHSIKRIFCAVIVLAISLTVTSFSASASGEEQSIVVPNLPVWDGTVAESYADGDGTKDNPYLISNGSELALLMKEINDTVLESEQTTAGEYYKLTNDIVLNDISNFYEWGKDGKAPKNIWTPGGGIINYVVKGFSGYFDGNNYDIIGMYVNRNSKDNGLFGCVYNGQIKNLGIKYAFVNGRNNTSVLTGYARSAASNVYFSGCKVENCVIQGKNHTGAIVGYAEAYNKKVFFDKCSVSGEISGGNYVGGIAGFVGAYGVKYNNDNNYALSITNCINNALVSGKISVGGIFGTSKDFVSAVGTSGNIALLVENCINNGAIFSTTEHLGAIAGTVGPADREDGSVITHIKNCYANNESASGIFGFTLAATDASSSKLYSEAEMTDKNNFASFDFDEIWYIVNGDSSPSLRVVGDILGNGVISAEGVFKMISAFAGSIADDGLEFVNTDFNGDEKYDLADLNALMQYIRNKGASATK